jgi:hypothetical protein
MEISFIDANFPYEKANFCFQSFFFACLFPYAKEAHFGVAYLAALRVTYSFLQKGGAGRGRYVGPTPLTRGTTGKSRLRGDLGLAVELHHCSAFAKVPSLLVL